MLCPKCRGGVKLEVFVRVPPRDFVVAPSSMPVMLATNKQRDNKFKSDKIMLQCTGMPMLDKIINEPSVSVILS